MNRIPLTGLRADIPMGAMAAFGCLRVCTRVTAFAPKLSWERAGGSFHAVLWVVGLASLDDLVTALLEDVKKAAGRHELNWSDQIKTAGRGLFAAEAGNAIRSATAVDRYLPDWFAAFGSDLVLNDDKVEATPFDMSAARQRFLADALKLAAGLAEDRSRGRPARDAYHEALCGPWRYADDQHSLGWDPSTMKLGAFTYKAPTAMANAGVRAAVWLAFESLPFFPCFFDGRLITRGFHRRNRELSLYWPVWEDPISLATLGTLLGLDWPDLVCTRHRSDVPHRGISAVYRSPVYKPNKYLASFRTPELVFGTAAAAASA